MLELSSMTLDQNLTFKAVDSIMISAAHASKMEQFTV